LVIAAGVGIGIAGVAAKAKCSQRCPKSREDRKNEMALASMAGGNFGNRLQQSSAKLSILGLPLRVVDLLLVHDVNAVPVGRPIGSEHLARSRVVVAARFPTRGYAK
jgi:hypothetical protein